MDVIGKFKKSTRVEVTGTPCSVSFAQEAPHAYVVASGARVSMFLPGQEKAIKAFTKFKDNAFGACLRPDGTLVASGCADGRVKIFETVNRTMLRNIRAHSAAARVTAFLPGGTRLLSAGDDRAVNIWDIATGARLHVIREAHSDYIRAAAVAPFATASLAATGGYDGRVRLWDVRPGAEPSVPFAEFVHGEPVEALTFLPGGRLLAAAGGQSVSIWEVRAASAADEPVAPAVTLTNHIKTVTSLACVPGAGVLLSGGLDHLIKVISTSDWRVLTTIRAPAPVLALGADARQSAIVAACADGHVFVKTNPAALPSAADAAADIDSLLKPGARERPALPSDEGLEWLSRMASGSKITLSGLTLGTEKFGGSDAWWRRGTGEARAAVAGDIIVAGREPRARLTKYERLLRQFEYRRALDLALSQNDPASVLALVLELERRGAVERAVEGANAEMAAALLRFCRRQLAHPLYAAACRRLAEIVVDVHGEAFNESHDLAAAARALLSACQAEAKALHSAAEIVGIIDGIELMA